MTLLLQGGMHSYKLVLIVFIQITKIHIIHIHAHEGERERESCLVLLKQHVSDITCRPHCCGSCDAPPWSASPSETASGGSHPLAFCGTTIQSHFMACFDHSEGQLLFVFMRENTPYCLQ